MMRFIPALIGLGLLLALSGCGQAPLKEAPAKKPAEASRAALEEGLRQAAALQAKGEFSAAAEIFGRLAATQPPAAAVDLYLRQARALLAGGETEAAARAMEALAGRPLAPRAALRARLLRAELALARGDPGAALEWLAQAPPQDAPADLRQRHFAALAQVRRLQGDLVGSADALAHLDLALGEPDRRLEVQAQLLRTLLVLPSETLQGHRPGPTGVLGGWMDLARILQGYAADPATTRAALEAWRQAHPGHPALPGLIRRYLSARDQGLARMGHIAVLLPARGRYARAARAITWGLLAAWYRTPPDRRGRITFYDSSDPGQAPDLLQQAVAAGATAVVGPLQKPALEALAQAGQPALPVLALNRLPKTVVPPPATGAADNGSAPPSPAQEQGQTAGTPETTPPGPAPDAPIPGGLLWQLALAPEDEADQAARRILADGPTAALAMLPQGPLGKRLGKAFGEAMADAGGVLAETGVYDPGGVDFRPQIEALFNLDASTTRLKALQSLTGRRFGFTPRRRRDAAGLFLLARPGQARQLLPQMVFLRLGSLPVYATSRANPLKFDPIRDIDLAGLRFTEIPWLVPKREEDRKDAPLSREHLAGLLPEARGPLARLVALGLDAYAVLAHLQDFRDFPGFRLPGATGELSLDPQGRFHRRLVWLEVTPEGILPLDRPAPAAPPAATEGAGPAPRPEGQEALPPGGPPPAATEEDAASMPSPPAVEVQTPGAAAIPEGGPAHARP